MGVTVDLDEVKETADTHFPDVATEYGNAEESVTSANDDYAADGLRDSKLSDSWGFHQLRLLVMLRTSKENLEACGEVLKHLAEEYDLTDADLADEIDKTVDSDFEDDLTD